MSGRTCPECNGSCMDGDYACDNCGGHGEVWGADRNTTNDED